MSLRSRGATVKRAFVFLVSTVATYSILHYLGGLEGEEEGDFITSHASSSFDDVDDAHPHNIRDELQSNSGTDTDSNVFMSSASPSPSPPPPVPPTTTTKEEKKNGPIPHP